MKIESNVFGNTNYITQRIRGRIQEMISYILHYELCNSAKYIFFKE